MSARWLDGDRPAALQSYGPAKLQDVETTITTGAMSSAMAAAVEAGADSPTRVHRRHPSSASSTAPRALNERTDSQNNRLSGIRMVPYSPSRIAADGKTPDSIASVTSSPRRRHFLADGDENENSDASERTTATARRAKREKWDKRASRGSWGSLIAATAAAVSLGSSSPTRSSSRGSRASRRSGSVRRMAKRTGNGKGGISGRKEQEGSALVGPGSVSSTPGIGSFSLARAGFRGVSGSPFAGSPTGDNWPASASVTSTAPLDRAGHASPRFWVYEDRESVSQLGGQVGQFSQLDGLSFDHGSGAASPASSSYTLGLPRPPLVISAGPPLSPSASVSSLVSASSSQLAPRPNSRRNNTIAVHSDKTFSLVPRASSPNRRSPPLSFSSTLRSTISHERLSSALFSTDDLASSAPSTNATHPDRISLSPAALSPDSSAAGRSSDPDAAYPGAAPPWNYRVKGNLRRVPKTPGLRQKGKGKARAVSPSNSFGRGTVSPASSVTHLPSVVESSPLVTNTVATASPPYGDRLPAKKPSFASDQSAGALSFSASTISINTNYKVYAHTSSPVAVAPGSAEDYSFVPSSAGSLNDLGNTTNIEILGRSSPPAPVSARLPVLRRTVDPDETFSSFAYSFDGSVDIPSTPNVVILGASSPPAARFHSEDEDEEDWSPALELPSSPPFPPQSASTEDSEPNYELYGEPSTVSLPQRQPRARSQSLSESRPPVSATSTASSFIAVPRPALKNSASAYSQESLVVRPLQPLRKRSNDRFGYIKTRSRESLRHAASIKSISSVILNQEAASIFFAGQAFLNLNIPPVPVFTATKSTLKPLPVRALPISITTTIPKRKPVASLSPPPEDSVLERIPSPSAPPQQLHVKLDPTVRIVTMDEEHPHQWSSQLSTVISESEPESSGTRARAVSGTSGRRSSTGRAMSSTHSRNMPSISSSMALQLDEARTRSRSDSLIIERPRAYSSSPSPGPTRTTMLVRDQDEHGDGLVDLQDIRGQPSRAVLSGFFASSNGSTRNLHSSGSSRASSRGPSSPIPTWARVYYGSGERRHLSASFSDVSISDDVCHDHRLPLRVFNTRRQPRETEPVGDRPFSDAAILEMGGAGGNGLLMPGTYHARGLRRISSSVWSPHLRADRRASRFNVWDPPSIAWSTDKGSFLNRRSAQILAFTVGFIFPFAWMVAAFLPLPPDPQRAMEKNTDSEFGVPAMFQRRAAQVDEARFQSARWWRTLNRVMSVFGLLILGAVIALIVVGVREQWAE